MSITLTAGETRRLDASLRPITPPFDPWSYDVNGDGVIDIHELLPAISDYIAGKITIDQLLQVINIYTTEPVTPPPTFDPWAYDIDGSGYIEIGELLDAISDYIGGKIDIDSLLEVINLYMDHIYRWG